MRGLLTAISFAVAFSVHAYAQGGDGRSDSARLPASPERRSSRTAPRNLKTTRVSPPAVPLPETGRVTISVSEGNSRLQLFREGSESPIETIDLPTRSTSLIVRKLDVGSYTIAVKKAGFHDVKRSLDVVKNQGRRVSIDLRPQMAILSVSSNVADAKISVSNVGDFDGQLEKAFVRPGKYGIKVSRRGYISREFNVDLKTAGLEERLNVILEPSPIDGVLDVVFGSIAEARLTEAEALINDVLSLNPKHAKANLALGLVSMHRGDMQKAVDRLLLAIAGGETFALPIKVRVEPNETETVAATLKIDQRLLRIESAERAGLNFSIIRTNLGRPDVDGGSIVISGEADYHGRLISPRIQAYVDRPEVISALLLKWQR